MIINHQGYTFKFVSQQSENLVMQNTMTHVWKTSLTVAVLQMPEQTTLSQMMEIAGQLLYSTGFDGWIISLTPPDKIHSFEIHAPETESDALLVLTMTFRTSLPDAISRKQV